MDPITIGLAFTAAQQAVAGIKKAIALGKDIQSLHGQFSKFFENSDTIHVASTQLQLSDKTNFLSDSQIRSKSFEIAMQSKALRDSERELKDMLIWSGNKDVWDQMMAERVRMFKERAAAKQKIEEAKAAAHMKLLDRFMIFLIFVVLAIPVFFLSLALLVNKQQ